MNSCRLSASLRRSESRHHLFLLLLSLFFIIAGPLNLTDIILVLLISNGGLYLMSFVLESLESALVNQHLLVVLHLPRPKVSLSR